MRIIFTLTILYILIYGTLVIMQFAYNILDFWVYVIISLLSLIGIVILIEKLVRKLDKND
jgi:hypothetical protein